MNGRSECYNPLCEETLRVLVDDDVDGYCSWDCAETDQSENAGNRTEEP